MVYFFPSWSCQSAVWYAIYLVDVDVDIHAGCLLLGVEDGDDELNAEEALTRTSQGVSKCWCFLVKSFFSFLFYSRPPEIKIGLARMLLARLRREFERFLPFPLRVIRRTFSQLFLRDARCN